MRTEAPSTWELRRGPALPSAGFLGLMLAVQLATFVQGPVAAAIAAAPADLAPGLALAGRWGACHAAGFAVGILGLPLLAALFRRHGLRGARRPAAWLAFYGVFTASGLLAGALRAWLCLLYTPALMIGQAPIRHAAHTALLFVIFAAIAEALTEMRDRLGHRLAERQALSEALARSRGEMVATDDAQRRTVAELLHGELQTHLVVASAHLVAADQAAPGERAAGLRQAEAALAAVRVGTLGRLHERLDERDLPEALGAIVARFRDVRPLAYEADPAALAAARRVSPRLARLAGLLAQEALLNAHRHAGPQARLSVVLAAHDEGSVVLRVQDDGQGFVPGSRRGGLGLEGLADGLAGLGARWDVASAPGAGTTVTLQLPTGAAA